MKKLSLTIIVCIFALSIFSQSKIANKWSAEAMLGIGNEFELDNWGLEYGLQINYSLLDRLGFYTSLGSFQSLFNKSDMSSNYSNLLWNLDVFGDIIRTQKGHRLRLAAGATYFKGDLGYVMGAFATENGNEPFAWNIIYYNNIGINVNLSYHYPITEKWYLGVNAKAYDIIDGLFLQVVTVGVSVGYNF
ncbi:MAG: hypothetical protein LBN95_12085 [Prevotellaceae bacterium]|jgi:hypothetical protein|nr:hypothetical protein [Prevotellaceae bacterium]